MSQSRITQKNNINNGKKIRELRNEYNKKLMVSNDIELMHKINADGIYFSNGTSMDDIKKYRALYKNEMFGIFMHCSKEMAPGYRDYAMKVNQIRIQKYAVLIY